MPSRSHQEFQTNFMWVSFAIAIFGGFTLGTHIIVPIGFQLNLPRALPVWIEIHGHLQLIGWVGFFIMGVSLYFIPRLIGVPIQQPNLVPWVLRLTAFGLIIRTIFQFSVPYIETPSISLLAQRAAQTGAVIEWLGILIYIIVLVKILTNRPANKVSHIRQIQIYFLMMITGLFLYEAIQVLSMIILDEGQRALWNQWAIKIYMALVLFPVAFAFSVRTFPLFMHIPPLKSSIRYWGYVYLGSAIIMQLPMIPLIWNQYPDLAKSISDIGSIVRDVVILGLIWQLNILNILALKSSSLSHDAGFGRFKLLLYAAYLWLIISVLSDIILRVRILRGLSVSYGYDPIQHAFLLGFITLLIFGIAQRMLPGFMHKRRLAHPKLVSWTFIFGNAAVLTRVIPLLIPLQWIDNWPMATKSLMFGFGISGFLGIMAVTFLALNLWMTSRMSIE